jgi:hypothetical protein
MLSTTRPALAAAAAAALLAVTDAAAQSPSPKGPVSPDLQAVFDCRAVAADAARLACFEGSVARLQSAFAARDVVVVDREQARTARREAFGFSLPSLNMFDRLRGGEDLDDVTLTVDSASREGGLWTLRMTNGQIWRQTQSTPGAMQVRRGAKAEIRRGVLGAYFMNVDGRRALKVARVR